jgi:hypothetical protein
MIGVRGISPVRERVHNGSWWCGHDVTVTARTLTRNCFSARLFLTACVSLSIVIVATRHEGQRAYYHPTSALTATAT